MYTIGFLVNPIAGMGGTVGLKGTDGQVIEAVRRGAVPKASDRARETLVFLKGAPVHFLTCSGPMGEEILREIGITSYRVVYESPDITSAEDTRNASRVFQDHGAELILFCGGDGTARDIYDVVTDTVPMLGIPAGVKMYSSVFAVNTEAAAEILIRYTKSSVLHFRDAEVMDIDEEEYRLGNLQSRLVGYAKSPYLPGLVQGAKRIFEEQDDELAKEGIGKFIAEVMQGTPDILYIIGPGSTTRSIVDQLGMEKTLLGFDAVLAGKLIATDMNEQDILALLSETKRARLVISIIGAQGSVLGRGTQQVSPQVIRKIGVENIIVIATPHKLSQTPVLFLDTGVRDLDGAFGSHLSVISGYHIAQRKRIGGSATE